MMFTQVRAAKTVNMCHIKLLAHTMFIVYLFCRRINSGEKAKKKKQSERDDQTVAVFPEPGKKM